MIDTQVLSKAFKGGAEELQRNVKIASVTAKEFLLAQSRGSRKPLYFVLHPAVYSHLVEAGSIRLSEHFSNPKWARIGSHRTDQLIIDFGNEFSPYREYSDQALALVINGGECELYRWSISHLPKDTEKYLLGRFWYLVENSCYCILVINMIVQTGLELFSVFTTKYNCNDNFSNTVNDVLIFATAVEHRLLLRTQDVLLGRFAAEVYNAPIQERGNEVIIDFSHPSSHN